MAAVWGPNPFFITNQSETKSTPVFECSNDSRARETMVTSRHVRHRRYWNIPVNRDMKRFIYSVANLMSWSVWLFPFLFVQCVFRDGLLADMLTSSTVIRPVSEKHLENTRKQEVIFFLLNFFYLNRGMHTHAHQAAYREKQNRNMLTKCMIFGQFPWQQTVNLHSHNDRFRSNMTQ